MAGTHPNTHVGRKSKARTTPPDPAEASRQIAAKIAQLERETAGEKDQDAEIDQEVRKANKEITQLLAKVESPTERVDIVRDKYLSLVADFKRLDRDYQKIKKRADQYARERDALRTDLSKSNTIKDKLAKMSRDTVAEIKVLKASLEKLEMTEIRSRRELHERLDGMVSEVHNVVSYPAPPRRAFASAEPDLDFKSKFDSFVLQQELRELQYISMLRTMHLVQLSQDARLERKARAQEQETSRTHHLSRQVTAISQTESELRSQLNVYVEKFRQVEETLNSSNDLFMTFRKEMEDMSKKTKRLEKENQALGRKVETGNRSVLELKEERNRIEKRYSVLEKRNSNLEKLCRGMQAQGRSLPPNQAKLLSGDGPFQFDDSDRSERNGSTGQNGQHLPNGQSGCEDSADSASNHDVSAQPLSDSFADPGDENASATRPTRRDTNPGPLETVPPSQINSKAEAPAAATSAADLNPKSLPPPPPPQATPTSTSRQSQSRTLTSGPMSGSAGVREGQVVMPSVISTSVPAMAESRPVSTNPAAPPPLRSKSS